MKLIFSSSQPCKSRRQRGTQIVEFAVVLPLLSLLGMIIIEAGSFVRAHQVINNAAREAAHISSLSEGKDFIDTASQTNVLGFLAACKYLNNYKNAFPGWTGDPSCGSPFEIVVEDVGSTDPDAIIVDGVNMPSTRAIVRYHYTLKYFPHVPFFGSPGQLTIQAKAQFRNFY
jgi:hypothetical protein